MIKWIRLEGKYDGDAESAKLGKYIVGSVYYDGMVSKGSLNKFKANCLLPGIKDNLGHFETREQAKEVLIKAIKHWIKNSELKHQVN